MDKLNKLEKAIMIVIAMISILAILFGISTGFISYMQFNSIQIAMTTSLPLIVIGCGSLYVLKKKKGGE